MSRGADFSSSDLQFFGGAAKARGGARGGAGLNPEAAEEARQRKQRRPRAQGGAGHGPRAQARGGAQRAQTPGVPEGKARRAREAAGRRRSCW